MALLKKAPKAILTNSWRFSDTIAITSFLLNPAPYMVLAIIVLLARISLKVQVTPVTALI